MANGRRKITAVVLAGLTVLTLAACARGGMDMGMSPTAAAAASPTAAAAAESTAGETGYQKITAEEAKKMMDAGGVTVVDVRTAEEYAAAHIPGAVLVPVESIGEAMPEALPDKDAVLLVYCRSGRRSAAASQKLAALGYTAVYDFGGINDWPYETEAGAAG